jgi:hypothetical protein
MGFNLFKKMDKRSKIKIYVGILINTKYFKQTVLTILSNSQHFANPIY